MFANSEANQQQFIKFVDGLSEEQREEFGIVYSEHKSGEVLLSRKDNCKYFVAPDEQYLHIEKCLNLKKIIIPNAKSVTVSDCKNLTTFTAPNVRSVVFYDCNNFNLKIIIGMLGGEERFFETLYNALSRNDMNVENAVNQVYDNMFKDCAIIKYRVPLRSKSINHENLKQELTKAAQKIIGYKNLFNKITSKNQNPNFLTLFPKLRKDVRKNVMLPTLSFKTIRNFVDQSVNSRRNERRDERDIKQQITVGSVLKHSGVNEVNATTNSLSYIAEFLENKDIERLFNAATHPENQVTDNVADRVFLSGFNIEPLDKETRKKRLDKEKEDRFMKKTPKALLENLNALKKKNNELNK
jgi:hypothetical protein